MNSIEHELRHHLSSLDHEPVTDPVAVVSRAVRRERTRQMRRRAGLVTVSTGLVLAMLVAIWASRSRPGAAPDVGARTTASGPAPTTAAASIAAPTTAAASTTTAPTDALWSPMPPDPRGPTYRSLVVWTGREAIVAGGIDAATTVPRQDVSAYDPASSTWRNLASWPDLADRVHPLVAWTGAAMLVIGGDNPDGSLLVSSGSAYDATTDAWRTIATPPIGFVSDRSPFVWTGTELLVWPADGGSPSMVVTPIAYDPTVDRWRELPPPPIERRQHAASVWTGTEWIVWGGRSGASLTGTLHELADGAAYDPAIDRWRVIAPSPLEARRVPGVWTGREMLVTAGASGGDPVTFDGMFAWGDGAAYDPATDRWRSLHDGPAHPGFDPVWTGTASLLFAKNGAWVYEPRTDRWTDGGPDPYDIGADGGAVWTGTTALLFGVSNEAFTGDVGPGPRPGGATFSPPPATG